MNKNANAAQAKKFTGRKRVTFHHFQRMPKNESIRSLALELRKDDWSIIQYGFLFLKTNDKQKNSECYHA